MFTRHTVTATLLSTMTGAAIAAPIATKHHTAIGARRYAAHLVRRHTAAGVRVVIR